MGLVTPGQPLGGGLLYRSHPVGCQEGDSCPPHCRPQGHIPQWNPQLISDSQCGDTPGSASFERMFLKLYIQQTSRVIFLFQYMHNFHNESLIRSFSSFRSTPSNPRVTYVLMTHDQSTSFRETCKCHHYSLPIENPETICNNIYFLFFFLFTH